MTLSWRVARLWAILNFRVAHTCGVHGRGFLEPQFSVSHWPIPICPFFVRGMFRMGEKPECQIGVLS
jgi:hypothetical protein